MSPSPSEAEEPTISSTPAHRQRLRVRKACLPCRLSKLKCNGKEPCSRCIKQRVMCVAGVDRRKPAKRNVSSKNGEDSSSSFPKESIGSKEEANIFRTEIHSSIVGSDASASSPMHLCYGPASNFVFLRQLYRLLSEAWKLDESDDGNSKSQDSLQAIRELGYLNIFFGTDSTDPSVTVMEDPQLAKMYNAQSLNFDMAATFLEMYISTIHLLLPFCAEATLRRLTYAFYSNPDDRKPTSRDGTLVLSVLAVGATLTDQSFWSESLFQQARSNISSWGDSVSLRSVQILILLCEFQHIRGRPNSAWLTVGSAVHKAIAVGLQNDIPSGSSSTEGQNGVEYSLDRERHATMWTLYAYERLISLPLGRPASLKDMDIDIPDPEFNPHLKAMVDLARIANTIYYGVYRQRVGSLSAFFRVIHETKDNMENFHKSLPPELQFPLDDDQIKNAGVISVIQIILAFNFFQNTFSCLRPCLILDAARLRYLRKHGDAKSPFPNEWTAWLEDVTGFFRKVNMSIIHLFATASDRNPIIGRLRHSRFFIETACFVLLFDALRDPLKSSVDDSLRAVEEGIQCFLRIPVDKLLLTTNQAISRTLKLTREIVYRARGSRADSFEQSVSPAGMTTSSFTSGSSSILNPSPTVFPDPNRSRIIHAFPDFSPSSTAVPVANAEYIPTPPGVPGIGHGSGTIGALGGSSDALSLSGDILDDDIFASSCYLWTDEGPAQTVLKENAGN